MSSAPLALSTDTLLVLVCLFVARVTVSQARLREEAMPSPYANGVPFQAGVIISLVSVPVLPITVVL